jgi:hypothetical protein
MQDAPGEPVRLGGLVKRGQLVVDARHQMVDRDAGRDQILRHVQAGGAGAHLQTGLDRHPVDLDREAEDVVALRIALAEPGHGNHAVGVRRDFGHREGDDGAHIRARPVAEDIVDPDFVHRDEEVFLFHLDRVAAHEDQPAGL